jgi:hypothetical protein
MLKEGINTLKPGVAILHTIYGIYHLGRKPSGRTPASSASYMLFSSFFDVSIIPFYAFSALVAVTGQTGWTTVLSNQELVTPFSQSVFFLAIIGGGMHLVSLGISLYLALTFRKITKLPPDMNPLEDNLTSRHKRNKSSVATTSTSFSNISEKRISNPIESKRSSGAAYEDLSRPPTIPFFHTRTQSTTSFSTYKDTPPPSRSYNRNYDSRADLPSRQYQIPTSNTNSPRNSIIDLKRTSAYGPPTPPKRTSYAEIPLDDTASLGSSRQSQLGKQAEALYTADSFSKARSRSSSPKKNTRGAGYEPVSNPYSFENEDDLSSSLSYNHPNPLEANPPTPRHAKFPLSGRRSSGNSPLAEVSYNRLNNAEEDITDIPTNYSRPSPSKNSERDLTGAANNFKAKYYGELKPGPPPLMVGEKNDRQVSSGNDYGKNNSGIRVLGRRDVSGKIAEEGRGGDANGGLGARFRKVSGLGN